MELIALIVMSALLPIMTITAFLVGFNVNASKKVFTPKKKTRELTDDEKMLERIDSAQVYDTEKI